MIEFKTVFFQYWMPGIIFDINKMKSWKKLALNFFSNEKPVISDVKDFVKEITREIVKAKTTDKIVYLTKKKKIIKDNIDKLSEHLLENRSDDEKDLYYFNESFFNENCELKGNLSHFTSELKEELRNMKVAFTRDEYKFCIKNFPYQKSSLPTDYVTGEEIQGFLNKLVFAVNQPNEVELGNIIANEISNNPIVNEFLMSKFQIYMLDWLKQEKAKLLTEKDAKKFFEDTSSNLRMSYYTEDFLADIKKHGIKFNSDAIIELNTNFQDLVDNSERRILNIITEQTELISIKLYQILQEKINYSYIFLRLSTLLELGDAFSLQNNNLLVIVLQNVIQDDLIKLIHKLKSILNEYSMAKIILIGSSALLNNADLSNDKYEDRNLNLIDLTLESQKKILVEGIVSFQGQDINLDKLLNCKLCNAIDGNILSNLIHKQEIKIGAEVPNLSEDYYIMRKLKYCMNINPDIQKDTQNSSIFENYQHLKNNLPDVPDHYQDIIIVCNNSNNEFNDFCIKYSKKNIHWLKKNKDKLIWKQSYGGNLSKLREFIDKSSVQYTEPKIATDIKEKVIVIVAEPGMGKSTLLTHLALQTKKSEPTLCILKINLIDNAETFQSWIKKRTLTESDINDFLYSCYLERTNEGPIKALEKTVFDYCYQEGKLIVMFDAFDEITPNYKNVVIKILKVLQKTTIGGLWITTRPYNIKSEIENVLNTFSYSLEPMSEENQISFLKSYWAQNLKAIIKEFLEWFSKITNDKNCDFVTNPLQLRMIAEIFQSKFEDLLSKNYKQMFGGNLSLLTLYEKFIDHKFYKVLMQEKKSGINKADPHMTEMIENARTHFISNHKKLALLSLFGTDEIEILSIDIGNSILDIKLGKEKAGIIDRVINDKPIFIHKSYAEYFAALWMADNWNKDKVKIFLRKHIFKEENYMIRKFFDILLASENNPDVIEDGSERDYESENSEQFLKDSVPILNSKYKLHAAILNNNVESIIKILESENLIEIIRSLDKGGRSALHLIASYNFTTIWNLINSEQTKIIINNKDQIFGFSPLLYAEKCGSWNITDSLLEEGANSDDMYKEIDNINEVYKGPNNPYSQSNMTLLHITAERGLLNLTKVLLEKGSDVKAINKFGATALHLAAIRGKTEIVKLLLKSVEKSTPDKLFEFLKGKNQFNYTALHLSALYGKTEVIKYLINLVETKFPERILELLNMKQKNGYTALHIAAQKGKTEIVELLIKSVEKSKPDQLWEFVNEETIHEGNALYNALGFRQPDIVKILINYKGSVVARNNHDTILHQAVKMNNEEILQLILNEIKRTEPIMDPFINANDNEGDTPLMWAAENGHLQMVKMLLEYGANLDMQNNDGETALHWATKGSYYEIVKLLLLKNANSNINDKNGKTPIKLAVEIWNKDPKNENSNLIMKLLSRW